jgi:hypothetical protein
MSQALGTTGFGNFGNLGAFTIKSGIAIPSDLETLGQFQGLQRAVNVGLNARGLPTISVDGEIGSRTLAAVNQLGFTFSSVEALANSAAAMAAAISQTFGVTPNLTPAPAAPRPPAPTTTFPAVTIPAKSNVGKILLIGALALLGVGAIFVIAKGRKRKRTTAARH